jgi:hypothetical protein
MREKGMSKKTDEQIKWLAESPDEFKARFEAQLRGEQPVSSQRNKGKRKWQHEIMGWLILIISIATLPFITLIRSSLILHQQYELNGWLALAGGALLTTLLLVLGVFILFRKVKQKKRLLNWAWKGGSLMVIGFCIYALLFISGQNTKNDEIRSTYRSLHPVMRVTLAVVTLADTGLIITDISRSPEDYLAMGLTPLQSSRHYPQEDGFVYAIDLRTIGQSEIRNTLLRWSFNLLGFDTIRHTGTADHLHVALPS